MKISLPDRVTDLRELCIIYRSRYNFIKNGDLYVIQVNIVFFILICQINSYAFNLELEKQITDISRNRCASEIKKGKDYTLETKGNGDVHIHLIGKKSAGLKGSFVYKKNEWEGSQFVKKEDQAIADKDFRKCVFLMSNELMDRHVPDEEAAHKGTYQNIEGSGINVGRDVNGTIIFNEQPVTYEILTEEEQIYLGGKYTVSIKSHPYNVIDKKNCAWSLEPSDVLVLSTNNVDNSSCNIILESPILPISRIRAGTSTTTNIVVRAQIYSGEKVTDKIEKKLRFYNHFHSFVNQDSHTISESSPVTVSILSKQSGEKIDKHFKCEWLILTQPFKYLPTSENGCEGIMSFDASKISSAMVFRKISTPLIAKINYANQEFSAAMLNLNYDSQNAPPEETNNPRHRAILEMLQKSGLPF